VTAAPGADGLPTPEQALQAGDKPLVSLAVLDRPSNLASFKSKDPFKPLLKLADGVPTDGSELAAATDDAQSGGTGGGTADGGTGGGGSPTAPGIPGGPAPVAPTDPQAPKKEKFTYTLDATLDGPNGVRRFRNMPRLRMLPSENAPLLVFLGVDATSAKAVFLVDSTVTMLEGEGNCSPAKNACATLSMEPGERQTFTDGDGQRYTLQIDQISERSLASLAKAARAARKRKKVAQTAVGYSQKRRFVPPVLTEILTGVQQ
jgi:hypothetical protein